MNTKPEPGSVAALRDQIRELDNIEFFGLLLCLSDPAQIKHVTSQYADGVIGEDVRVFRFIDLRAFLIIRDNGREWTGKIYLLRAGREVSIGISKSIDDPDLFDQMAKDLLIEIEQALKPVTPLRDNHDRK